MGDLLDEDVDGYVDEWCGGDDCDDYDEDIYPDAPEVCNWRDDDCDELVDEGFDQDGDGWTTCGGDCDDGDADAYPGGHEICDDGVDQNCDGVDHFCSCWDNDADGFQDLNCGGTDCDDSRSYVYPGAPEPCGHDYDCDGMHGECVCDDDTDGYAGYDCGGVDCDDSDAGVNPGAVEICDDGIDQDCDGYTDADDSECPCRDKDGDGFSGQVCGGRDCNDSDAAVHPGAAERCNQQDDDCDGQVNEDFECMPGETRPCSSNVGECVEGTQQCVNCAWAECVGGVLPAEEICDGKDNDCDGTTDGLGTQTCGKGPCQVTIEVCVDGQPQKCMPLSPEEYMERTCTDGIDNDCDGNIDYEDINCKGRTDGGYKIEGNVAGGGCGCGGDRSAMPESLMGTLGILLIPYWRRSKRA